MSWIVRRFHAPFLKRCKSLEGGSTCFPPPSPVSLIVPQLHVEGQFSQLLTWLLHHFVLFYQGDLVTTFIYTASE